MTAENRADGFDGTSVVYCWGCDEFHPPPRCHGDVSHGAGEPRTQVPQWHARRRAAESLFGWSSDHEWAVTWWPLPDYL